MPRVVAIGLDAVEPSYLEELVDRGDLPALARLRAAAARVRLVTEGPYRAEYPWTEFVTGRGARSVGYWSTVAFDPATYGFATIGAASVEPFYALGPGRRVIALDVPHSRLSERLHGAQVIGWGAHDPEFPRSSRPAGLLAALEREHGVHPGLPIEYAGTWHQADFLARYTDALVEGTSRRVGVVRSLLGEVPDWELLVLTLSEAHTAGHYMWHGVDPNSPVHHAPSASVGASCLRAIHQAMDRTISDMVEEVSRVAPDAVFVVFSIKGMATADADLLSPALVPELFHRLTFGRPLLRASGDGVLRPPIVPAADVQPIAELRRAFADGPRGRVVRALRGRVPRFVRRLRALARRRRALARRRRRPHEPPAPTYDHLPIHELVPQSPGMHWHGATWYQRHWPRMPAFVIPSYSDVHVRINLQGRERDGVVPREEYDDACDRVEAILRACTNPRTGRPIVRHVTRLRAPDPCAVDGPSADLVVECVEPVDVLVHPEAGTIGPFAYPRTGSHTPNGLAWFAGGDIAAGDLGVRPALDLAPTLLTLLGASTDGCEGEAIGLGTTGRAVKLETSA